jgi:protein-S-isoprenylcysteine O-methyltransferase Ste14
MMAFLGKLEHRVPPPLIMVATAGVMWAVSLVTPGMHWPAAARFATGALFLLAGLGFAGLGLIAFRRAGTTINPLRPEEASAMVTDGIYRVTRNPMYVGFASFLIGWGILLQSWAVLAGPIVFVMVITRLQILPEERALKLRFGSAFDAYRARVRRWL